MVHHLILPSIQEWCCFSGSSQVRSGAYDGICLDMNGDRAHKKGDNDFIGDFTDFSHQKCVCVCLFVCLCCVERGKFIRPTVQIFHSRGCIVKTCAVAVGL